MKKPIQSSVTTKSSITTKHKIKKKKKFDGVPLTLYSINTRFNTSTTDCF